MAAAVQQAADLDHGIAGTQLHGGTKDGPASLDAGRELTDEKRAALGLDEDAVARLVRSGVLIARKARVTGGEGSNPALQAALARAEAAEAEVVELKAQLEEATTPTPAA